MMLKPAGTSDVSQRLMMKWTNVSHTVLAEIQRNHCLVESEFALNATTISIRNIAALQSVTV